MGLRQGRATWPVQPDILPGQCGDFHKTETIIQWEVYAGHNSTVSNGQHVTPSIYIEKLLQLYVPRQ